MQIFKKIRLFILAVLLAAFLAQVEVFAEDARPVPNCKLSEQQIIWNGAQYYFQRGHRFYLDSKPDPAEREFKEALKLNPKLCGARYYLGSIYFKQERYNEAIKQCKEALKINPRDLKSLLILGLSFRHTGLIEESIGAFLKAQNIDSHSAAVRSALGLAYCAKGDPERAMEEYNTLRQIDLELADDLLQKISEAQLDF